MSFEDTFTPELEPPPLGTYTVDAKISIAPQNFRSDGLNRPVKCHVCLNEFVAGDAIEGNCRDRSPWIWRHVDCEAAKK